VIALSAVPVIETAPRAGNSGMGNHTTSPQEKSLLATRGTSGALLNIHKRVDAFHNQSRVAFGVTSDDSG